jgi:integrase/recombinase XerC
MLHDTPHSEIPVFISEAMNQFIGSVTLSRSLNTAKTYQNGINIFKQVLFENGIDPSITRISDLKEDAIIVLANALKSMAPTTERLYLTAVAQFYEYISAENLKSVNLPRIRLLIHQRARRPGHRLPQFPKDAIDEILEYSFKMKQMPFQDEPEHLRNLRDRAFLVTLADTGLRVHEACNLRRGDLDWNEGHAIITGKGDQQAVVRFSARVQQAIKEYLAARSKLDGKSGKPIGSLPLFARHDKGAGEKIKAMTTTTGRNIVNQRVQEVFGKEALHTITPHSFRHYFVTRVLQGSGNLKLAQELARHKSIAVTTRYAHLSNDELDKGYWEIFENDIPK